MAIRFAPDRAATAECPVDTGSALGAVVQARGYSEGQTHLRCRAASELRARSTGSAARDRGSFVVARSDFAVNCARCADCALSLDNRKPRELLVAMVQGIVGCALCALDEIAVWDF